MQPSILSFTITKTARTHTHSHTLACGLIPVIPYTGVLVTTDSMEAGPPVRV